MFVLACSEDYFPIATVCWVDGCYQPYNISQVYSYLKRAIDVGPTPHQFNFIISPVFLGKHIVLNVLKEIKTRGLLRLLQILRNTIEQFP